MCYFCFLNVRFHRCPIHYSIEFHSIRSYSCHGIIFQRFMTKIFWSLSNCSTWNPTRIQTRRSYWSERLLHKKTFSVTYYLQLQFFSYACVSECNICSFNLYKYYDKLTTEPKHDFFYVALLVSQYDALELYTFKAYVSVSLW